MVFSCPTWLVDRIGIGYRLRTEQLSWLSEIWPGKPEGGGTMTYRERLNWECHEYRRRCGDNSQAAIDDNYRGDHWASVPGVDRQSKKVCFIVDFHSNMLQLDVAPFRSPTGQSFTVTISTRLCGSCKKKMQPTVSCECLTHFRCHLLLTIYTAVTLLPASSKLDFRCSLHVCAAALRS